MSTIRPPSHLGKLGKRKWKQLAFQIGELQPNDLDALALLAGSWETYLTALADVQTNGTVLKSAVNGRTFINPNLNAVNESHKQIIKLSKAFGIVPTSRNKDASDKCDPMADLISGDGAR